ncbi:MAG: DUF2156 domain-containing protein [Clostridia bacterium]|nr:DUF2156 domain-containing protein [Clostridia bacterium]
MPEKSALAFEPVTFADYDRIFPYTAAYGEGSCQHSPVSMISLAEKYGDSVCIQGGFLYTLRSRLCDEAYRVYLAPLGSSGIAQAYRRILEDAAAHGKRAKFITLTEKQAGLVKDAFPDRFAFQEERDLAEYQYRADRMAAFPGGELRKRRQEVHTFWNQYGQRASVERIRPEDFESCLQYERKWLRENLETHDADTLMRDARMIDFQIAHFDTLRLSGVILRIDGAVCGFCYGTPLGDTYDVIVEKADRGIPHCYKVLRQESTKQCAAGCRYVNMEEDLGLPGLRALKMAYKPDRLLRKLIVTERK